MASPKMKLYYYEMARSSRVIWLIKEMGVEDDFEFIQLEPNKDKERAAVYKRDVHPLSTVPALVIPGPEERVMLESGSICLYLAERYGKLLPKPENRPVYYDSILFANATLDELLEYLYVVLTTDAGKPEAEVEKYKDKFNSCMLYLSKVLKGKDYLCGNFTACDCVLGFDLWFATMINDGELLKNHPTMQAYAERLKARTACQQAFSMK